MGVDLDHRGMASRLLRLTMLGAVGGAVAALVFVTAASILLVALRGLWQFVAPDVQAGLAQPPLLEPRRLFGIVGGFVVAGGLAGAAAAWFRASERADGRSFGALLLGSAVGGCVAALIGEGVPHSMSRAAAILMLSTGLGALGWIGLWPRTVRALRRAPGTAQRIVVIARRAGSFAVALFALLVGAPFALFVLSLSLTAILHPRSSFDWGGTVVLIVSCLLSLGTGVAGLYVADVPRSYDTGDALTAQRDG